MTAISQVLSPSRTCNYLAVLLVMLLCVCCSGQDAYVEYGSVRGKVHVMFEGYDLPLKQSPVYMIEVNEAFSNQFLSLKTQILPQLDKRTLSTFGTTTWIAAAEQIIAIEKKRVVLFRKHTVRTLYADNSGMFVFHDVKPGNYLVFVEGVIRDHATIWKVAIELKAGQNAKVDFGPQNVGDTREVYR